ncbi:MAG TPA: hypothetical protein PLR65_14085 [Anaerolineales bacterium]|nr:hypothetical protein [Anaerolineales bacterium]
MKQHEAVILAMKQNGGYATLGQLYQSAPRISGSTWGTNTPFASNRRFDKKNDEFFKIRPGLWALTSEKDKVLRLFAGEGTKPKEREYSHYFYQGLVAEIGNLQGFKTYVPAQDRNKPFAEQKLGNVTTVSEFYEFTYSDVLRRAKTIDVTWFNDRKFPGSVFEIEHSTDIQNSLLKFVELQDFRTKFYIVADSRRKAEFDNKISFYAFSSIKPYVKFWDYDSVLDIHAKVTASNLAVKEVL